MHGSTLLCNATNPLSNYYYAVDDDAHAQNIDAMEIEGKMAQKGCVRGKEEEDTEEELKRRRRKNRMRGRKKRDKCQGMKRKPNFPTRDF